MRSWTDAEFVRRMEQRVIALEQLGGHAIERQYLEEAVRRLDNHAFCAGRVMDFVEAELKELTK